MWYFSALHARMCYKKAESPNAMWKFSSISNEKELSRYWRDLLNSMTSYVSPASTFKTLGSLTAKIIIYKCRKKTANTFLPSIPLAVSKLIYWVKIWFQVKIIVEFVCLLISCTAFNCNFSNFLLCRCTVVILLISATDYNWFGLVYFDL